LVYLSSDLRQKSLYFKWVFDHLEIEMNDRMMCSYAKRDKPLNLGHGQWTGPPVTSWIIIIESKTANELFFGNAMFSSISNCFSSRWTWLSLCGDHQVVHLFCQCPHLADLTKSQWPMPTCCDPALHSVHIYISLHRNMVMCNLWYVCRYSVNC